MKNKLKKTFAAALAALTMTTAMAGSASAANYSVSYVYGRPSSLNSMGATVTVDATNLCRVKVTSTQFTTYATGAYIFFDTVGNDFPVVTQNVNNTGTYYLDYLTNYVPKPGTTVKVKYTLTNFSISRTVEGSGTVTA